MTELAYHGNGFIEATHKGVRVFVDPVFSQTRRGRRARAETRPCDFLLVRIAFKAASVAVIWNFPLDAAAHAKLRAAIDLRRPGI